MLCTYLDSLDYTVAGVEGPDFDDTNFPPRHLLQDTRYVRLCFGQMTCGSLLLPTYCRVCGNEPALLECIQLIPTISRGSPFEEKTYAG